MNNYATFYIVRHGETEWNVKKLLQGHGDSPLTSDGINQVSDLAKKLSNIHFDHVYSSDLMRARRTAKILNVERKLAINTTHLLRERAFGKYEGRRKEEFEEENRQLVDKFEKLSRSQKWVFKYADDIESSEELIARMLVFLRETAVAYAGKSILVVTHGGALRVLLEHLGYESGTDRVKISNGAYVKLLSDGSDFEIKETSGIGVV
jgi:probable phosphoglycerate mutase